MMLMTNQDNEKKLQKLQVALQEQPQLLNERSAQSEQVKQDKFNLSHATLLDSVC